MASLIFTASCDGDYLDTYPTESVATATAVGSTTNAYKALNGLAYIMTTQHSYYGQGFCGENYVMVRTEEYPGDNYNYNYLATGWSPLFNGTFNTEDARSYNHYIWYYYYQLISGANSIIMNIDDATGADKDKEFIKASALTFRAFAYEKLCRYYCKRWVDSGNGSSQGVVLRLDESTGGLPYSTLAECYAQIYKDCEEAISLFKSSGLNRTSSEVWIPNINVAYAVYARAALNRLDYATALTNAQLAEDGFPLMSNTDYLAGFMRPTSEWIFGSYGDATENHWYWTYGTQYSCNGYYAGKYAYGAGAIQRELINRIPNTDVRKSLFLSEEKFPDYASEFLPTSSDKYMQTYCIMGLTNSKFKAAVAKYVTSMVSDAYKAGYYYLGGQLKFQVFDTPGVSYLPFIRTSEMVLIEAEANYKLGKTADAQAALIKLNKTSGRNTSYTCEKTGDALWQEIKDYRKLELFGEGFNWSDLKRWKDSVVRTTFANGGNCHASTAITIAPTDVNEWVWVVPKAEIDYNDCLKNPE